MNSAGTSETPFRTYRVVILLFIAFAVAFVARVPTIGHSYYTDEAFSWTAAASTLAGAWNADRIPGLFYALLHAWMLVSIWESWANALMLVLAGVTAAATYGIARLALPDRTAFVAAALLATSPGFLVHAGVLRAYGLAATLVALMTWAFLRAMKTGSGRTLVSFAVLSALCVYAHPAAVLAVVPLHLIVFAAAAVGYRPVSVRRWSIATLGSVLLLIPAALHVWRGFADYDRYVALLPTANAGLAQLARRFAKVLFVQLSPLSLFEWVALPGFFALLALFAAGVFVWFAWRTTRSRDGYPRVWTATVIVVPVFAAASLLVAHSLFAVPFSVRYLVFLAPLIAIPFAALVGRFGALGLIAAIGFMLAGTFHGEERIEVRDWRGAARAVAFNGGETLLVAGNNRAFIHYLDRVTGGFGPATIHCPLSLRESTDGRRFCDEGDVKPLADKLAGLPEVFTMRWGRREFDRGAPHGSVHILDAARLAGMAPQRTWWYQGHVEITRWTRQADVLLTGIDRRTD